MTLNCAGGQNARCTHVKYEYRYIHHHCQQEIFFQQVTYTINIHKNTAHVTGESEPLGASMARIPSLQFPQAPNSIPSPRRDLKIGKTVVTGESEPSKHPILGLGAPHAPAGVAPPLPAKFIRQPTGRRRLATPVYHPVSSSASAAGAPRNLRSRAPPSNRGDTLIGRTRRL